MSWKDEIRNPDCELCSLHEDAEHVCLMGSGPRSARIMIIGEAPGEREDAEHRAFTGRAGKMLDSVLKQIGIDRDSCYVTNVAKCRPESNRTPDLKEIKMCVQSYLTKEMEAVKPEYVLLLGNSALRGVIGRSGIMKQAGTVYEVEVAENHYAQVMPIIHPAAVLRNPKWASMFSADMVRFANLTRGVSTSPETKVKLITKKKHLVQLREILLKAKEIAWDIETDVDDEIKQKVIDHLGKKQKALRQATGQDWHGSQSYITTIAFSWEEGLSACVPIDHAETPWSDPEMVLDYLGAGLLGKAKTIAHNGKFDARWLHSKGIPVRQTFDTMLAAHILEENRPKGLKPLSRTLLGADPYDIGEEVIGSRVTQLKKLARYNGKDTDYTLRLYHSLREQLKQEPRLARVFKLLMMPASEALVDIERRGVYIDQQRWEERYIQAQENRDKLYRYIQQFVPPLMRPINLRSSQQVGQWMFGHLKLPILEKTAKGGAPSTKESVLLRLQDKHPAMKALIKYRKWEKYVNTYLGPWKYQWMDDDGRIHSSYKLYGTVTGRLSGEGGIQQVPRDTFIRSIVGAPPGWKLLQADYSQIELRVVAMLSNERRMIRQYLAGEDIHMIRAMKMVRTTDPQEVSKEQRKKAKAVNFGYVYGMGAPKFVKYAFDNYELVIELEEAQADRESFFEDYPALRPWHNRQRNLARRYGFVASPIGRIRHLPDIKSADEDVRAESERQAINSPVQSFASDLMLISLIILHKELDPKECRIVFTVHDAIGFECREDKVAKWAPVIKEVMEDMSYVKRMFGTDVTIPIVADLEVGDYWGEGEPWQEDASMRAA